MKILLPIEIQKRLIDALRAAGSREIGGVLMGEHIQNSVFQVVDITIQKRYGQSSFFVRKLEEAVSGLRRFFQRTGKQYDRFNYLGEWHSHPSFPLLPSHRDIASMIEILTDTSVGANFVVLLIIKLDEHEKLYGKSIAFLPNREAIPCELVMESI